MGTGRPKRVSFCLTVSTILPGHICPSAPERSEKYLSSSKARPRKECPVYRHGGLASLLFIQNVHGKQDPKHGSPNLVLCSPEEQSGANH